MRMDGREVTKSQKLGEAIRETSNGCETVRHEIKRGVDWGRGEERKVKGAQKIKERKKKKTELQEISLVEGQKWRLIRTREPFGSRKRNLLRGTVKDSTASGKHHLLTILGGRVRLEYLTQHAISGLRWSVQTHTCWQASKWLIFAQPSTFTI